MNSKPLQSKQAFILQSLLKTALYLLAVIAIIIAGKHFFRDELDNILEIARHNLPLFYFLFFLFEILPGQLPPEIFFIIHSRETTTFAAFLGAVFFLSCLSYVAINLSYYLGKILPKINLFGKGSDDWFKNNSRRVIQYGSVIIVLAMFTPLPSALISMAAGYLNFPAAKFRMLTLARFIRFMIYGPVIYFAT